MSEPRRLLSDPSTTPFERGLLESWTDEQPSDGARRRAVAIVGGAVAVAAAGAGIHSVAPKAAVASTALSKWVIVLALVAGGATTFALARRSPTPTPTPTPTAATAARLAPMTEPPAVSPADLPEAPARVADPVAAASSSAAVAPRSLPTPSHDASLAEEIALFDRARATLDAGDPSRALVMLDAYDARFHNGAFVDEAKVLRVRALLAKGDRTTATRLGEQFLAAHPNSPHAVRLHAILGPSSP